MSSFATELGVPGSSAATVVVKALNIGGEATLTPASFFLEPVLKGYESASGPIYAFLVEHPVKGRIMFDLGYRQDVEGFSPAVKGLLGLWASMGPYAMVSDGDVATRLQSHGVDLSTIKAVIWSHCHSDHIGDMSTLPSSTELIVGPGTDLRTYPQYPEALLVDTDTAGRKVTELSFEDTTLRIADLPALDLFGDDSFYILDAPGHHPGHIVALARTTADTFVLLGGDCCHHPALIRPTTDLHVHCPCPGHLVEAVKKTVSTEHFPPAGGDGKFDILNRQIPMLEFPKGLSVYHDVKTARDTADKIAKLDACPDVLVLLAHDSTLPGRIDEFPESVNDWKAKGWKKDLVWAFLEKGSPAFRFAEREV